MRYYYLVLQRGAAAEDMGEGSVLGRPHRLLLGHGWFFLLSSLDTFLFIYFVWLCWRELPGQCWIEVGRAGILTLFLILGGESIQSFTIRTDVTCRFFIDVLLVLLFWEFSSGMHVGYREMFFVCLLICYIVFLFFSVNYGELHLLIFEY